MHKLLASPKAEADVVIKAKKIHTDYSLHLFGINMHVWIDSAYRQYFSLL